MKTIDEIRRDNLLLAIKRFRTAAALAEAAKTNAAYLSQIKGRRRDSKTGTEKAMGDDVARKIEEALGEPEGWMDVAHNSPSPDQSKKSHNHGMITESFQASGASMSEASGDRFDKNVTPTGKRRIPVISYVQAGMMTEVVDPFALGDGFEVVEVPVGCSARTFGLRIEGNSMEPRFHEGDVVIIDPSLAPRPGDFVVGKNGKEEATFKKYRPRGVDESGDEVFELAPLNEDYPTLHSKRDGLIIIGVCVGRWEVFRSV